MRVKPAKSGKVLLEVGSRDVRLLAEESVFSLKRILVPTDFSETSSKAVRYAMAFAKQFKAELVLLHVVEIYYGVGEAGLMLSQADLRKEGEQKLAQLAAEVKSDGIPVNHEAREGVPYDQISQAAGDLKADLIIIATHGRRGFPHLFMGSTAERVVRHAPCPVLVVRQKEHEFLPEAFGKRVKSESSKKAERT